MPQPNDLQKLTHLYQHKDTHSPIVSLMHLPAIYVFYDHKYCMYELEDEEKVMEKFKCEVYEI